MSSFCTPFPIVAADSTNSKTEQDNEKESDKVKSDKKLEKKEASFLSNLQKVFTTRPNTPESSDSTDPTPNEPCIFQLTKSYYCI